MLRAGDYLAAHLARAPVILVFCFKPELLMITDISLGRPSVVGGAASIRRSRTSCSPAAPKGSAAC